MALIGNSDQDLSDYLDSLDESEESEFDENSKADDNRVEFLIEEK